MINCHLSILFDKVCLDLLPPFLGTGLSSEKEDSTYSTGILKIK